MTTIRVLCTTVALVLLLATCTEVGTNKTFPPAPNQPLHRLSSRHHQARALPSCRRYEHGTEPPSTGTLAHCRKRPTA